MTRVFYEMRSQHAERGFAMLGELRHRREDVSHLFNQGRPILSQLKSLPLVTKPVIRGTIAAVDFCGADVLVINKDCAVALSGCLSAGVVEYVPVECRGADLVAVNVITTVDCVDERYSRMSINNNVGNRGIKAYQFVEQYVMLGHVLSTAPAIFRLKYSYSTHLCDEVVRNVLLAFPCGLDFREVMLVDT